MFYTVNNLKNILLYYKLQPMTRGLGLIMFCKIINIKSDKNTHIKIFPYIN